MSTRTLEPSLTAELGSIAARCGCELLHARFKGGVLLLVIDRDGGIGVEDCARVSREASALLDVEDFGPSGYSLEVSSPGLDREFYRDSDYERFAGHRIRVTWRDGSQNARKTVVGELAAAHLGAADADDPFIEVTTEQERLVIPLPEIVVTRLEPEF